VLAGAVIVLAGGRVVFLAGRATGKLFRLVMIMFVIYVLLFRL
jgi:hypothetical protein